MGNIISGAVEGVTGKGAAKAQEKAMGKAGKFTDTQTQILLEQLPFLKTLGPAAMKMIAPILASAQQSNTDAAQFDPAQESERGMLAYDTAAKESLQRDLGETNTPFSMRGFTEGNGSSDQGGANADLLARRATDRAMYSSGLKMREKDRLDEVRGRASDQTARAFQLLDPTGRASGVASSLQGPAQTQMGIAGQYGEQASNANPGSLIPIVSGALQGIQWPWQKKKSGNWTSNMGTSSPSDGNVPQG